MASNSNSADMMDVGQHCSLDACHRLDFLPITCPNCTLLFCKEHSATDAHHCPVPDRGAAENHLACDGPKSFPCCVEGCGRKELTPIECEACCENFCLKHRHQVDHECKNIAKPEERMTQTKQHIENLHAQKKAPTKAPGRGRKSKATAAKVMLMKIKMKASGDKGLPDTEKIFLQVLLPKGSKDKTKAMFFSDKWTVGHVIDTIANACGLLNNNNIAGKPKLRLFDSDDGTSFDMSKTLGDLAAGEEQLVSGSSVVLEYVDEAVLVLENVSSYKS